ncbi:MAG: glutaredoxin domain-containing protein [Candidatus Bathyarchaeia archaeon]
MTVKIELFYSPLCPYCLRAKELLLDALNNVNQEVHLEETNVLSNEGLEKAKVYGVTTVPTIIINNRHKVVGAHSQKRLVETINEEATKKEKRGCEDEEC